MKISNKVISLCLLLILVVFSFGCGEKKGEAASQEIKANEIPVETLKVSQGTISKYLIVSGRTNPQNNITVNSKIAGVEKIVSIKVKEGDNVRAEQTIAVLEQSNALIQLNLAQIVYDDALKNFDRNKKLFEIGAISKNSFEQIETAYQKAKNNLELQRIAFNNTKIKSPISGVITKLDAEEGALVSSQTPIATIANIEQIEVNSFINEKQVNKLSAGDNVKVYIPSTGNKVYEGKIVSVGSVMDNQQKAYPIKVILENNGNEIKAGMYAQVEFITDFHENVLKIPRRAVITKDGESKVFIVDEGKAVLREVVTGLNTGSEIEITEGLQPTDEVIVVGNENVVDGDPVKVINRGEQE